MPQIIVTADQGAAFGDGAVTLMERVNVADFESEHFAAQLVERLGWAVEDADEVERRDGVPDRRRGASDRRRDAPESGGDASDRRRDAPEGGSDASDRHSGEAVTTQAPA
jgi:hypothetical protein